MKTKLLSIAMMVAFIMTAMTKVQAQNFEGPCLPSEHGLDGHQSAFCGSTETQTIELLSGKNWVSFYVETDLDALKAALVEAVANSNATIQISSQTQNVKYQHNRWVGQLAALDLAQMYLIEVPGECELVLEGTPVNPATLTIDIAGNGRAWIAYPYNTETSLNFFNTFAGNNDQVQSQLGNAKYNRGRWSGQLTTLTPGKGYIYISADPNTRTFVFPTPAKGF